MTTILETITKAFDDYPKEIEKRCLHCLRFIFKDEFCDKCIGFRHFICNCNTQQFKEYLAKKLEGKC